MTKITQSLIFSISLTLLLACSESTNTGPSADTAATENENSELPAPAEQQKIGVANLDLSLPDETIADQKIHIPNEQPLMPARL